MKHSSVKTRLYSLVALFSILLIVIGALGLRSTANTLAGLKTVYEDRAVPLVQITEVKRLLDANVMEILRAFQHNPQQELSKLHDHPVEEHLKRIEGNLEKIEQTWQAYLATYLTPEEKTLSSAFTEKYKNYTTMLTLPTVVALRKGDYSLDTVSRFLKGNREFGSQVDKLAESLIKLQTDVAKSEYDAALTSYESARTLSILAIVLGVGLGSLFSWWLIASVTGPLDQIRDTVSYVQNSGDFTRTLVISRDDEVGKTAHAFNALLVSLRETLGQLLQAIQQVSASSAAMSDNAQQSALASNATSESASAMAASVEEMSVSVSEVASGAQQALERARQAGEFSLHGGEVIQKAVEEIRLIAGSVGQVSTTITELGTRSERISGVVQVIKEVAEQTNLLALNAAIEAARAGEQGRGFAVVADEVRKLAERTTAATGEISQMVAEIQNSARSAVNEMSQTVAQVEAGVALAGQAGQSINDIRASTADVVHVVGDITNVIVEQGGASQSIATQVERVAQAAEENSATANESSESAAQMHALAERMNQLANRFKI
ncbi:MAG: methyl-accepting chemotaxis protein [Rhodocyclales bacterium GT-UBC]|nr:MAG: methyl-accepting chemotaxis protein [Rhodocyclales bacterium GT-UBC]